MLSSFQSRALEKLKSVPAVARLRSRTGSTHILGQRPPRTPDFQWEILPVGLHPRLDAGLVQIGSLLYCIGGYASQDEVLSVIDIFDTNRCRWNGPIPLPPEIPQSHLALACEAERFLYFAGGQLGARCSPCVAKVFALNLENRKWRELPPLPAPRYAGTMQLLEGRLHFVGGAEKDRYTPSSRHWSLAVCKGRALEEMWREETPIPRGGMHRASAIVQNQWFVFGGQEGDFIPFPNDPCFACDGQTVEQIYPDSFQWNARNQSWTRLPDMIVPASHTEFSVAVCGDTVFLAGGSIRKDAQTFAIELTDIVQAFNTRTQRWNIAGYLPFRSKTSLLAIHDNWLYLTAGQRDQSPHNSQPGFIEARTWRARFIGLKYAKLD